jgi:hypothetical protein
MEGKEGVGGRKYVEDLEAGDGRRGFAPEATRLSRDGALGRAARREEVRGCQGCSVTG